uniref:NADH-ubiquinone oxidoreductase chain 2 n=1 Tax=Antilochus coquebertii TaxID=1577200 RepID=A0A4Y1JW13_9HEMI|nr:NADH dehydrogenase subunit 2 [Antilochus coquebertii]APO08962.1 NADH dehydrogenase subunit 2 [Antilochus coquebertii]
MKATKMIFALMLMTSTLITLNSSSWLGMWMGMEMNLMSFIPLMKSQKNKKSSESMMMYFLTQSISSIILLFTILASYFITYNIMENIMQLILTISLMIKMASAPFHMWLPETMANLSWKNCAILMTWQKIAPLAILSNNLNNNIMIFIFLSAMTGAMGGMNQTSFRKIMAYSSINHLSWMMMLMVMNLKWYIYMMFYSIIIIMILIVVEKKNILSINQMMALKMSSAEKIMITSLMMSMGGLPPFIGFVPKWMVIQSMMSSSMWLIMTFMVLMSLITLFYYLRMMYPLIMSYNDKIKWMKKRTNSTLLIIMMPINLLTPMMMNFPLF